jgi:hypothetical protein
MCLWNTNVPVQYKANCKSCHHRQTPRSRSWGQRLRPQQKTNRQADGQAKNYMPLIFQYRNIKIRFHEMFIFIVIITVIINLKNPTPSNAYINKTMSNRKILSIVFQLVHGAPTCIISVGAWTYVYDRIKKIHGIKNMHAHKKNLPPWAKIPSKIKWQH